MLWINSIRSYNVISTHTHPATPNWFRFSSGVFFCHCTRDYWDALSVWGAIRYVMRLKIIVKVSTCWQLTCVSFKHFADSKHRYCHFHNLYHCFTMWQLYSSSMSWIRGEKRSGDSNLFGTLTRVFCHKSDDSNKIITSTENTAI